MRLSLFSICLALMSWSFTSSVALAGACTYSEAMMAFEQGNSLRGQALMRMAANDGDIRAERFLASIPDINPVRGGEENKLPVQLVDVAGNSVTQIK